MANASNIDPAFLDPYFDVGRVYTAPYLYGTTGLAVDTSQVPEPPTSWAEFFAVPEGSDGSIGMMNDQIEVIHAVLRAVGVQPCSTDSGRLRTGRGVAGRVQAVRVGHQFRRDHRAHGLR